MQVEPVTLEGTHVRLVPLSMEHAEELHEVAQDDEIWQFLSVPRPQTLADTEQLIKTALSQPDRLPFAAIDLETGRVFGTTSYLDIRPRDKHVEIGWTWYGKAYWRTPRNSECKYLLLQHAFERLGTIRVTIKTDGRNLRSQRAIERIGGVREGVLRRHMVYASGYVRDTVYYSILDNEWPIVKTRLENMLNGKVYQEASHESGIITPQR